MLVEEVKVVKALTTVIDPKSGNNIVTENMIKGMSIEGQNVQFTLILSGHLAEARAQMHFDAVQAIRAVYADAEVHIHMENQTPVAKAKPNNPFTHIKNIIAVASGKGGVGKSTISANLALGLKRAGHKVGLVDADLYGPSIPKMIGLEGERPKVQEFEGKPKILPLDAHGIYVMSIGFIIEPEQAVVLRGPRLAAIIKQFFFDCVWPELDYLIVDLPPGTGDIQLTLVQTVPVTGVVMVTTPQKVAVADAIKAMNMFLMPSVNVPILGVVENMSWFTPEESPGMKYYIFGKGGGNELVKAGRTSLLGQVPLVQSIRESGDNGSPSILVEGSLESNAFNEMAVKVKTACDIRNEERSETKRVTITT